jgi:hypothetical protein
MNVYETPVIGLFYEFKLISLFSEIMAHIIYSSSFSARIKYCLRYP